MIDFRYLLTTIVAIFLALAIGLLIGSGLLADEIAEDLERQVQETIDRNNELRAQISALATRIDADENFGRQVEARWVEGQLTNDEIVVFRLDGTDDGLVDRARDAIQLAGGSVATTITITERMAMDDAAAVDAVREELAALGVDAEGDLEQVIGRELGRRAAADALGAGGEDLAAILQMLEEQGFISVEAERDRAVPLGADFVVAAGSAGDPPFDIRAFTEALLSGLGDGTSEIVAVEGWQSVWDFVPSMRQSDVRERVSTVDHGDTPAGAISMVLELDRIPANEPGHYGFRDGADGVVPENLPGD